jgi:hypothetical protein
MKDLNKNKKAMSDDEFEERRSIIGVCPNAYIPGI